MNENLSFPSERGEYYAFPHLSLSLSLPRAFFAAHSAVVLAHNPRDEAAAQGTARATAAIVYYVARAGHRPVRPPQ